MTTDLSHETEIVPAFYEIDPMDIVWHGHYVKYLEVARAAHLGHHGYSYAEMKASGYAWPIVDMRLKYVRSARLGVPLVVRSTITEWENRLRIDYVLRDAQSGEILNKAHTIQVAVELRSGQMQYVCPRILWERLGVSA
jgi:acyl-CoA thioester hydrolase